MTSNLAQQFLQFSLQCGVLRFGQFRTKAGRDSPYFFNAGLFNNGASIAAVGQFYAQAALASGMAFDMIFGPAYKGIPLAVATACSLANIASLAVPFAYNRKEVKDHGEGGVLIGAPLAGRILIIDDVISAGTSVGESVAIIRQHGATPAGVLIALDRQEKGYGELGAVEEVRALHHIPVYAIATVTDLMAMLAQDEEILVAMRRYIEVYGCHTLS